MTVFAGRYAEDLQDRYGNGYRNAKVAVETIAGDPVTLYADRTKAAYVPALGLETNEIKADSRGNLSFFADPGNYQIVVTPSGRSSLSAVSVSILLDPLEPMASQESLEVVDDTALHKATDETVTGIKDFQEPFRIGRFTMAALLAKQSLEGAIGLVTNSIRGLWIQTRYSTWAHLTGRVIGVQRDFGAIADWQSHPLSERYASLAAAQVDYPHATSLTQQIDWAALQGAINAVPTSLPGGSIIELEAGGYRLGVDSLTRNSSVPILFRGATASSFSEDDSGVAGSAILVDAGSAVGVAVGGAIANPNHRGPSFQNIAFRELGAGRTTTLLRLQNVNRWSVHSCAFFGASKGIDVVANNGAGPGAGGSDASWGFVQNCVAKSCTVGLNNPHGTDLTVVGGDWECTTNILAYPAGSLTASIAVMGAWFDGGIGVDLKGYGARVVGCAFERCNPAVQIQRDSLLHSNSGQANLVSACLINGVGLGDIGVNIGANCAGTLIDAAFMNVATPVLDNGTGTTIQGSGSSGSYLVANQFKTGGSTTAARPSAASAGVRGQWYDTTLSKPIWSDGANWRDAAGNIV